jgi:ATP-dependent DNA ligase
MNSDIESVTAKSDRSFRKTVGTEGVKTKADFVEPMLGLAVSRLPEGPAWS